MKTYLRPLLAALALHFIPAALPLHADSIMAPEAVPAGAAAPASAASASAAKGKEVPPVVHSRKGDRSEGYGSRLSMVNIGKRQQYSGADRESFDTDIFSPKSVTFSPDGSRLYVNSLEGCRTAVYSLPSLEKLDVIKYEFPSATGPLWASPSGYYNFTHYPDGASRSFGGKPVESAWSHGGRYLWIPFYRRTFDINAQDPSAMAVIDARTNEIVRMFETGPLPKVVAVSPDNSRVVVAHWGDNTVGFIDISSDDPSRWHHLPPIPAAYKFNPDFPLDRSVNRDANSGYLLRGTAFTPDSRYTMVVGMGGPMSVFDLRDHKFVGTVADVLGLRHIVVKNGMVYGSINIRGEAVAFPLDSLTAGIREAQSAGKRAIRLPGGMKRTKVGGGARTLEASPDGKYLFVACNSASAVYVVETAGMTVVDQIRCDSYPVGLALSPDGRYMAVTSQGRESKGGNALNLFEILRTDAASLPDPETVTDSVATPAGSADGHHGFLQRTRQKQEAREILHILLYLVPVIILMCIAAYVVKRRKK